MWVYECLSKNTWFSGNTTMPIKGQLVYSLEGDDFVFDFVILLKPKTRIFSGGCEGDKRPTYLPNLLLVHSGGERRPTYLTCHSFTVGRERMPTNLTYHSFTVGRERMPTYLTYHSFTVGRERMPTYLTCHSFTVGRERMRTYLTCHSFTVGEKESLHT